MWNIEPNKLFVWNIDWTVKWEDLKKYFSKFWEVAYATISTDRDTGKSRWFGFVTFIDPEDVNYIMDNEKVRENLKLKWRKMYIDRAESKEATA